MVNENQIMVKSPCISDKPEMRMIDGSPMAFLEFQKNDGDLQKWRKAPRVEETLSPEKNTPSSPNVELHRKWAKGICLGCHNIARMISSGFNGNPFVVALGGAGDCICGAQDVLTDNELLEIGGYPISQT